MESDFKMIFVTSGKTFGIVIRYASRSSEMAFGPQQQYACENLGLPSDRCVSTMACNT